MFGNARILRWDADMVVQFARKILHPRMASLGRELVSRVRDNIGTPTAAAGPSRPGEFPHRDSGDLYRSVSYRLDGDTVTISANAPHAEIVEIERPYLRRTIYENQDLIRDTFVRSGLSG
jgi:hypothetical protein